MATQTRSPSAATDMQLMRAWLRVMRWVYQNQTGRLTEWPPESTEV